ncbi:DNA-processing protein DprA [Acinetobacter shaoyimingii]|uniref:DNA-protecting protein DprA n=1 Tax=Acinetobacter shaoyimingii TaxID=2715164 RepID=A0A6G8RZA6_9GAMM|nr:DNA-processing protein DprA [Acinetobacter shaoyimingii]QIO07194.1 DNA-protecting protein DprA [Acinetobacter shaoyimingii]
MLNSISDLHLDSIKLWYLVQHSLSSYRKLIQYFGSVAQAIHPDQLNCWSDVKIHQNHIERARNFLTPTGQEQFHICLNKIRQHTDFILLDSEASYPKQLLHYEDRPPILFGKGNLQNLSQPQIAIVGSRKPSPHGKQVAYDFAYYLSEKGFFITSGLAQGIDEAAHLGALNHHRTIAVIGTGLDQVYPSQNQGLQDNILKSSGTVISEFLPETKPLQHNFPRRNRIVSGLSLGILVAEATLKSGSLITAKSAADQGKTIFAIPGHIYSEFHQGCHQLIREGAILVDHPEHIIEDLALPTQWQIHENANQDSSILNLETQPQSKDSSTAKNHSISPKPINLPDHLFALYQQLDWVGQDLDQLASKVSLSTAELTSALMELELLGLCMQKSGLYLRCRSDH